MYPRALPVQEMCLVGVANPYTSNWVKATPNIYRGGQSDTYDTNPSRGVTWWNFDVNVLGEAYSTVNPLPVDEASAIQLCQDARNSQNRHSILKVQVTYALGNTRTRKIRFDIGAGIDVFIPPTWQLSAIVLRPEVVRSDNPLANPVPVGFDPNLFFISNLVLGARCVNEIFNIPGGVWSNPLIISDPGNATRNFDVEEGAVAVSASFATVPTSVIQFIFQRRDVNGVIIDETILGSAAPVPPSATIPRTELPGGTNIIRYTQAAGLPIQGTITQHLEF